MADFRIQPFPNLYVHDRLSLREFNERHILISLNYIYLTPLIIEIYNKKVQKIQDKPSFKRRTGRLYSLRDPFG